MFDSLMQQYEGCSERTIQYYKSTAEDLLSKIEVSVRKIPTEEIRSYLSEYQKESKCTNVTIDNIRRNLSSFFSWLEEEDYILKSPMRRIHKIKTKTVVKNVITDEGIEKLRDHCQKTRDLAMIDLLYSTGIRVGELVNLNIDDIDLEGRECVVYGKGDKERKVYFDAKTKVHLKKYISEGLEFKNTEKIRGLTSALVSVGGNLRAIGVKPDGSQWTGGVENPWSSSDVYTSDSMLGGAINMSDMALVTSGDYQRYYVVDGKRYHHLIDPDTLFPAAYFNGVTVLCSDSGLADCLTTGLFCQPLEDGMKIVESLDGVEAIWCTPDQQVITSSGWDSHLKK